MRDAVARLTSLGVMLLALLREDAMHPYEMIRLLRARHDDRIVPITNGTVYHTVSRLERAALIAEVGVDRDGSRPERTTYALTDAGDAAVIEWVRRELPRVDRPAEFRIALAEAHNLPLDDVLRLLRTRLSALAVDRDAHAAGCAGARERGVPEQYLLEVERQHAMLCAEHDWLVLLLDRLSCPGVLWGATEPTPRYLAQREAARR